MEERIREINALSQASRSLGWSQCLDEREGWEGLGLEK